MPEPEFQDRVRHKHSSDVVTGTVIAKYPKVRGDEILGNLIDVRSDDDRIYWATPAENWEVTQKYKED